MSDDPRRDEFMAGMIRAMHGNKRRKSDQITLPWLVWMGVQFVVWALAFEHVLELAGFQP